MARIGHASIGSSSQILEVQKAMLKTAGSDMIRSETVSGSLRDDGSQLTSAANFSHEGHERVFHRLDRLGRSTHDDFHLVQDLDAKNPSPRILEPDVTTVGDMGQIFIHVFGIMADMEFTFVRNRNRAGIAVAKVKGVCTGRRKSANDNKITHQTDLGKSKSHLARDPGISRMTVRRAILEQV